MTTSDFHLAQLNIARMRAPLTDPIMADFVGQLDAINALADHSQGFDWRLQTESGNATEINAFNDPGIIVNLTVWESIDSLHKYAYRSDHAGGFRNRKQWFEPMSTPSMVLWWIPAGHIPLTDEAKERLELLEKQGPTAQAFTFKVSFPAEMVVGSQSSVVGKK